MPKPTIVENTTLAATARLLPSDYQYSEAFKAHFPEQVNYLLHHLKDLVVIAQRVPETQSAKNSKQWTECHEALFSASVASQSIERIKQALNSELCGDGDAVAHGVDKFGLTLQQEKALAILRATLPHEVLLALVQSERVNYTPSNKNA
ncbi:hypothetical protein [Agarivorans sp. B2Z047]|uniref:hypothetical protein n=2 Tax=Agarivorans sp. B2Z047 TaxID=2652721 RepID=UPI00201932E9|nr:hypothetical protein [Agarivorans sp. B2Z047]UQN41871.1 hypothetical protein LQZ07_19145 [Agarivorans sp. B2Z047]